MEWTHVNIFILDRRKDSIPTTSYLTHSHLYIHSSDAFRPPFAHLPASIYSLRSTRHEIIILPIIAMTLINSTRFCLDERSTRRSSPLQSPFRSLHAGSATICPLTDSLRKSHGRGLRSKSNSNLDVILSQRAQPHTEASTVQCTESTMTVNPPHPRLRVGPPSHSPDSNSLMAFLRLHGAPHNYCSSTGTGPRRAYMYTPKLCEASFASEFLNITPSNSVK